MYSGDMQFMLFMQSSVLAQQMKPHWCWGRQEPKFAARTEETRSGSSRRDFMVAVVWGELKSGKAR